MAGLNVAIAGGIAYAAHGMLVARQAQRQSDCAAWDAADAAIQRDEPPRGLSQHLTASDFDQWIVKNALDDSDMQSLWRARSSLASRRELLALLLPALRDFTFVGLRNARDLIVEGREMPTRDHAVLVMDDLFTRAGRASWLLKQATGHPATVIGVETDPRQLPEIARDWRGWLDGLDGGDACFPVKPRSR